MTGMMIYLPLYYQVVHKLSAAESGLALIPVIVMTTPGSMVAGRAMMYLRRYKIAAYVGMSLAIVMVGLLAIWPKMSLLATILLVGVVGFGVGTVFPVATVSVQNAVGAP